ncbi:hypothetical protein [Rhizobium tumorigenes]|uniref:Uncharacterized protein n=1 Tax=Rhizobium tumorigenes TaxID=2041385 RepID=A0AAF1KC65_9HYPH|nr:hypothetical protein [Rhizobium tumorigenes]WFR98719.1 hypothetical protein PR017_23755 [Rhizobium tumorigenes]
MAIASLRVPISALPSAAGSTSWLDALNTSVGGALDKASQDKALARLGDATVTGQLAPNQGFLSKLFGGQQQGAAAPAVAPQAAAVPASAAQPQMAKVAPVSLPAAAPDDTPLGGYLSDPTRRATLPAGMRNNNPGNIKFVGQNVPGIVGPSQNTDEGDPQAVFATPEAGMAAMHSLLLKKYNGGKVTADQIIAGSGGWTPGNHEAAANVARYAGLSPNQDINLNDPAQAAKFMRGLMMQEHGNSSRLYPDSMILSAVGGQSAAPSTQTAYAAPPSGNAAVDAINAVAAPSGSVVPSQAGQRSALAAPIDSQVTTAYQQPNAQPQTAQPPLADGNAPMPSAPRSAPQQVAQAGPQTLAAGVTPVAKGSISPTLIQQMLKDPQLNKIALQLWQQNATGKTSDSWDFVKLDDGTLARANMQTGEVQSLGNFQSSKKELLSNGKGAFYDSNTGQWISPPPGAGGDDKEFFGTTVPYYDAQGQLHYRQLAKDGRSKDIDFGPGATAAPPTRTIDTGTELVTVGPGGQEISRVPKQNQQENREKALGTELGKASGDAANNLPQVEGQANQLLSTIDSLSNDPYLGHMVGPWVSRLPTFSADGARVQSKMDQIGGQSFLQAFISLKGGGQITEVEGDKATKAIARLNTAQSETDYRAALQELRDIVTKGVERARQKAAGAGAAAPSGTQTKTGISWKVEE